MVKNTAALGPVERQFHDETVRLLSVVDRVVVADLPGGEKVQRAAAGSA